LKDVHTEYGSRSSLHGYLLAQCPWHQTGLVSSSLAFPSAYLPLVRSLCLFVPLYIRESVHPSALLQVSSPFNLFYQVSHEALKSFSTNRSTQGPTSNYSRGGIAFSSHPIFSFIRTTPNAAEIRTKTLVTSPHFTKFYSVRFPPVPFCFLALFLLPKINMRRSEIADPRSADRR